MSQTTTPESALAIVMYSFMLNQVISRLLGSLLMHLTLDMLYIDPFNNDVIGGNVLKSVSLFLTNSPIQKI